MRVLVLTPQPVSSLHDGLNLRIHHLFRELGRRHEVWVGFLDEQGAAGDARSQAGIPGIAGARAIPLHGRDGAPFRHCEDFSPEAAAALERLADDVAPDVIVAESIYLEPYARRLLARPLLLDLVDAMSLLVWRSFRSEPAWRDRLRHLRAWWFWRRYQREHLGAFSRLVVTSPVDARVIQRCAPRAEVAVLQNGVDAEAFRPWPQAPSAPEIVFTGVMGFRPNEVAAMHFYRKVFPAVRAAVPGARFTIAGRGPTERLRALVAGDPAVSLTGAVPDIRPYIGRAAVYVAPMISGSGIKNKILEAWSMARPVVATPMACAGLGGRPGATHVVAAAPRAFADAVVRLLRDRRLGDRIGDGARQLVLERYQWSVQAA
ncbi:MAG TPA: glycosyltransferase, partial [Methylomirabilota bacterium]|nr:glycosyltransferase [Methylomirabilota bacterium]